MNQLVILFLNTDFLHFQTLLTILMSFKDILNRYYRVPRFFFSSWLNVTSEIIWLFYYLKYSISQKHNIIIFYTCKVHIYLIPCVDVSTWIVFLMLYISISKLFKQILNSIAVPNHLLGGIMVFLMILP